MNYLNHLVAIANTEMNENDKLSSEKSTSFAFIDLPARATRKSGDEATRQKNALLSVNCS